MAKLGVFAAVFQDQLDPGGVLAGFLQLPAGQFPAQLEHRHRGLGDVDIDRIQLLDHRHGAALATTDQRALGYRRTADAPGDRRQHLGVTQVDLRALHNGFGLQALGLRLVELLTADGLLVDQQLVAIGQGLARLQRGLRAFQGRLVGRGVDLIKLLAGFDFAALGEQALENDAVDLRAHFGNAVRAGASRQLGGQGKGLGLQGDHADLRQLCGRRRFFLLATAEQGG
ncbi:hypothetical protein D9M68_739870 [compost metagenome]